MGPYARTVIESRLLQFVYRQHEDDELLICLLLALLTPWFARGSSPCYS